MKKIKVQWHASSLGVKVSIICLPLVLIVVTLGAMVIIGRLHGTATIAHLVEGDEINNEEMSRWDNSTVEDSELEEREDELQSIIYVDIKGAVQYPNVYALPVGSRLFDAIDLAGGLLPHAATQTLNQAQLLMDQSLIYIYSLDELEEAQIDEGESSPQAIISSPHDGGPEGMSDDSRLNINSASLSELQTLPGIGPKKAEAIIQYREQQGSFKMIEDLVEVSGIGDKTFEQLMSLIRVD